jgi:hypothetical protein
MLPWLPNLNPPGTLDEVGLNMSSWPPCWGVAWLRWMGPPKFRDPAVDHIDDWLALDIWALFDNDGNSLGNVSKRVLQRARQFETVQCPKGCLGSSVINCCQIYVRQIKGC